MGINGNYTDVLSVVARGCYIHKIQCTHGLVGEDKENPLQLWIPTGYLMLYGWMTHQNGLQWPICIALQKFK